MASMACELHGTFDFYHWTGSYRAVSDDLLVVGPYPGTHGCLRIPVRRSICWQAARTKTTRLVDGQASARDHIACSSTTQSVIGVPAVTPDGRPWAALDVDSDYSAAFHATDRRNL